MNKDLNTRTRERIHEAAKAEFMEKGFQSASLRSIVKSVSMTTGAFYGYYESKEALFDALVSEQYKHFMGCYRKAQEDFAALPPQEQPKHLSDFSGQCLEEMLHYAYEHLEAFKLILLSTDGTKFSGMVDEMVEIELNATHAYQKVLTGLGGVAEQGTPAELMAQGCAGCQKYGFNLREQFAKIALFPFLALLLAWVCTLF